MLRRKTRGPTLGAALLLIAVLAPSSDGEAQSSPPPQAPPAPLPSPEQFLGYPLGDRFTPYDEIQDYAIALADRSPLVQYRRYGASVEGRELFRLVIASVENHSRMQAILDGNAELTRTGTTEARAAEISARNPAIVYFTYGVHGNEPSSSEAAMWTAYDLASGSSNVGSVLDSLVVIIDPVANPDGRERYVGWYRTVVGSTPNASPHTREHQEPWPGGRFNHYLFDLNRDWAWMTQPETRARLADWWTWNPQIHVDFHEMSPRSSYFFFPAAAPINPIYPDFILAWGRHFGEANARVFDANGWTYFTGESYDLLYPGYGDTWPSLTGAIGMTYEQAGSGTAGLRYARADGDTLTLAMRATQHRTAGATTLRAAAAGKSRLLIEYAEAHRTAGRGEDDFLLLPGSDTTRLAALVEHLLDQGVEVHRSSAPLRVVASAYPGYLERREFPAGTALVRARQPRGRLAVTLLQPTTELHGEYSYDISAWSLPYAYGVEAHRSGSVPRDGWVSATRVTDPARTVEPTDYGYLVPANHATAPSIVRYLESGGEVRVLARPATFRGREWPAGSWFVPISGDLLRRSELESAGLGGFAVPVSGGLAESGIDLGSEFAHRVQLPRLALLAGDGVEPTSYGAHWFHLEQQLGMPFDAINLRDLQRLDLGVYDVLVLPATTGSMDDHVLAALRDWVAGGGRLIAVSSGAEAVARIGEIELRQQNDEEDTVADLDRLLATREERERSEWTEAIPGAIFPVRLDTGHPIAWGAVADGSDDRLFVLHTADRTFEPRAGAEVVASFGPDLRPVAGVVSDSNLRRMERSAWLISTDVGQGRVILFAEDPLFRLFWHASAPLYRNALLYGDL